MSDKQIEIIVLGSCVSRVAMLNGDYRAHGIPDDRMHLKYFLDKQNIALQMMPRAFSTEEIYSITPEQLWDGGRIHTVHQALNKETVSLILESNADYIVIDLFDFQTNFASYKETAFDTNAYEFMYTDLYKKYQNDISLFNFMTLPKWTYYPFVDMFFEKILTKFDSDHIILNRFRSNTYYLDPDGQIKVIPKEFRNPFQANDGYNRPLWELENYVIEKYNPYVIDLSKYYMGDGNKWDNLQGAHFEDGFYFDTFSAIKKIIFEKPSERLLGTPSLFNNNYPFTSNFDINQAYEMMLTLLDNNDLLWINILEKLYKVCPEDPTIREYVNIYLSEINQTAEA